MLLKPVVYERPFPLNSFTPDSFPPRLHSWRKEEEKEREMLSKQRVEKPEEKKFPRMNPGFGRPLLYPIILRRDISKTEGRRSHISLFPFPYVLTQPRNMKHPPPPHTYIAHRHAPAIYPGREFIYERKKREEGGKGLGRREREKEALLRRGRERDDDDTSLFLLRRLQTRNRSGGVSIWGRGGQGKGGQSVT